MTQNTKLTAAGKTAPGWDDGMVCRRKNMFWEQDFFPGQNAPIDMALFYPGGMLL